VGASDSGLPVDVVCYPPPLSPSNLGRPSAAQLCFSYLLGGLPRVVRGLVSRRKRRFFDAATGLDLDLSYITDSLIGAGYPSSGVEALYRNPAPWTRRFLEGRHGAARARVWNLCAERGYPEALLGGVIQCTSSFVWFDHTPPPFALLRPLCEDVAAWRAAAAANVAVIRAFFGGAAARAAAHSPAPAFTAPPTLPPKTHHPPPPPRAHADCKAGKGRTGTAIAAAMVHSERLTADAALAAFGDRRTHNKRGVTFPSQARYVKYYALQVAAAAAAAEAAAAEAAAAAAAAAPGGAPAAADTAARARLLRRARSLDPMEPLSEVFVVEVEAPAGFSWGGAVAGGAGGAPGGAGAAPAAAAVPLAEDAAAACVVVCAVPGSPVAAVHAGAQWQPLRALLAPGDVLQAVNGVAVGGSTSAAGAALAAARAPLTLQLLRRPAAAAALPPPPPPASEGEFWARVAKAVGPWAPRAPAHAAPRPALRLLRVALSHAPCGGGGGRCGGGGGGGGAPVVEVFGGAFCGQLLAAGSAGAALAWEPPAGAAPVVCGDFRVNVRRGGGGGDGGAGKVLASLWAHTAFLPLPAAARAAAGGGGGGRGGDEGAAPRSDDVQGDGGAGARRPTVGALLTAEGAPWEGGAGGGGAGGGEAGWHAIVRREGPLRGAATFLKRDLDKACKDKAARVWPADFSLRIEFELVG
jgi:hypothetical protein